MPTGKPKGETKAERSARMSMVARGYHRNPLTMDWSKTTSGSTTTVSPMPQPPSQPKADVWRMKAEVRELNDLKEIICYGDCPCCDSPLRIATYIKTNDLV